MSEEKQHKLSKNKVKKGHKRWSKEWVIGLGGKSSVASGEANRCVEHNIANWSKETTTSKMCAASYVDMESKVVHWKLEAEEGTKRDGDWQIKLVNNKENKQLSSVPCP